MSIYLDRIAAVLDGLPEDATTHDVYDALSDFEPADVQAVLGARSLSAGGGGGSQTFASVTVPSAQVLDLVANPVLLVAAPGAGKMLFPTGNLGVQIVYGGTPYTTTDADIEIGTSLDPNDDLYSWYIPALGSFSGSSSLWTPTLPEESGNPIGRFENRPITVLNFGSDFLGGNSDIVFSFPYLTIDAIS